MNSWLFNYDIKTSFCAITVFSETGSGLTASGAGVGPYWLGELLVQGHIGQSCSPPPHLPGKFLALGDSISLGAALLCQVFTRERMTDALEQSKGVSSRQGCEAFGLCLVFEPGKAGAVAVPAEPALSLQPGLLAWEWAAILLGVGWDGGSYLKMFFHIEPIFKGEFYPWGI